MVSKFIKCIPLFVVFFIANFIFINNVSANQVTCTYSGYVGDYSSYENYSFSVGLDDNGMLFMNDVNFTSDDTTNAHYDISADNKFKSSDFVQDNELVTKCPTVYATIVSETIYRNGRFTKQTTKLYIGASQEAVNVGISNGEENLDDERVKKTEVKEATLQTLTAQSFNRGDKLYLDGAVINETKPMVCKYKSEDGRTFNLQTVNDKSWINSPGFGANISIADLENQGNIPYDSCVKNLYAQCNENENRCVVGKGASGTKFTYQGDLELIGDSTLDGSFLGKIDGCEMLGSLGVLASELFKILQVIAICLLIVMGMKDFAAALPSGDNNAISKAFKSFVKRIAVIIILFLLPVLINWLLEQISLANNCVIEIAK